MMKPSTHSMMKNPFTSSSSAGYLAALALLFLSGLFLWLDNQELSTSSSILYWSLGINILFWGKWLTVPLALVCIFFWAKGNHRQLENWKLFTSFSIFILLFLALAFMHYVFAWDGSSLANVGTTTFAGDTYHIARIVQFDESTKYYLGRCTPTQFHCDFHEIFVVNSHYQPRSISIAATQKTLSINVDKELVYTYDGLEESCIEGEMVYCRQKDQ